MTLDKVREQLGQLGIDIMLSSNRLKLWVWNTNAKTVICITEGIKNGEVSIFEDLSLYTGRLTLSQLSSVTEDSEFISVWNTLSSISKTDIEDELTFWSSWDEFVDRMLDVYSTDVFTVRNLIGGRI